MPGPQQRGNKNKDVQNDSIGTIRSNDMAKAATEGTVKSQYKEWNFLFFFVLFLLNEYQRN